MVFYKGIRYRSVCWLIPFNIVYIDILNEMFKSKIFYNKTREREREVVIVLLCRNRQRSLNLKPPFSVINCEFKKPIPQIIWLKCIVVLLASAYIWLHCHLNSHSIFSLVNLSLGGCRMVGKSTVQCEVTLHNITRVRTLIPSS